MKLAVRVLIALAATAAPLIALTTPASAAPAPARTLAAAPHCNGAAYYRVPPTTDWIWIGVPAYMNDLNRNCVMGVGAQGDHVRALQEALARCHGQNVGAIDGIYGERTKRGVINVQARAGIRQDGIYGPRTEDFMLFPKFKQGLGFVGGCTR